MLAFAIVLIASLNAFAFELKAYPASAGKISLTWPDDPLTNLPFRLLRSTDGSTWSQLGSDLPAHTTSYDDTTVSAKQRYYYRVGSVGSSTVLWLDTTWAVAVYTGGPLWDWHRVTWTDNSMSETEFDIRRSMKTLNTCGTSYTNFTAAASAGIGGTVIFDNIGSGTNPPLAGTKYCYWVRSKNALTSSSWIGPVSITTIN